MESKKKLVLRCPVVVEGKYDKIRLSNIVESPILVLNGFSCFRDEQKKELLKRICREQGLILLMDSDRAGAFIRSRLKGILTDGKVFQVYAPQLAGKEKRKETASAEGLLGIEGTDSDILYSLLLPFTAEETVGRTEWLTKKEWYADGFSGGENAAEKRKFIAKEFGLPDNLSSTALLEAINLVVTREQYEEVKSKL